MSRRLLAAIMALAVLLAGLTFTAAGGGAVPTGTDAAKKKYTIYLVAGIASDAFYLTMKKGAQAAAKKLNAKVVFTGSPAAFSPPTQIPYLNAAIARKPDAISVNPGISTTDQRRDGFAARLKAKYKNINYLGVQYCNDDQTKASNLTSALMAGHPNLKGMFAMNVVSGNGVTAAVKAAGKSGKVKLVEFDAGPPQVQALKAGTIDALIAQYPFGIGQLGVQYAVKYLKGQRAGIKKHYGTGSAIVTRANVNSPKIKRFLYTP